MAPKRNPSITRLEQSIRLLDSFFGEPEKKASSGDLLDSLIRIILSQNTNDINSARAYRQLRLAFQTKELLAAASIIDIQQAIFCAGLYRQKSRIIKNILIWVKNEFGKLNIDQICEWPENKVFGKFTAQNGIGLKTVAVMLMFGCGRDIFPVDTHVHRISNRLRLVEINSSAEKTFTTLNPLIPKGKSFSFHVNLLKLGRQICLSRTPRCPICPLKKICPSVDNPWLLQF